MLQSMRNNLKSLSWILWLVVIALSVYVFANWGAQGRLGAPTSVVAWVDGEEIVFKDYVQKHKSMDDQYRQMYGARYTPEMAKMLNLPQMALDSLINTEVLLLEADRMGIYVSQEEVGEEILKLPMLQDENGNFVGQDRYKRTLEAYGMRVVEFEQDIAHDIIIRKVGDLIHSSIELTDEELRRIYRDQTERIGFEYVEFGSRRFVDEAKEQLTESDGAAFFETHSEDYRFPVRRSIEHVRFSGFQYREDMTVEDAEIEAFYNDNMDMFTQEEQVKASHILIGTINQNRPPEEAKKMAEDIYRQLQNGSDFAELAKEYSDDPGSAAKGGDLGFFPRGRMVGPFEDAAFGLQVDEVSQPVETQFGYHIVKVTDRREKKVQTLEEAREQIVTNIKFEKARELAETKAQEFAELAKQNGNLRAVAEEKGYLVTDSGFFANERMASIKGLGPATNVTGAAFSLPIDGISEPISTAEGMVVIQVKDEEEPRIPEFEEVRDDVMEDLAQLKAEEMAREQADRFRERVTPATFTSLSEKQGRNVKVQQTVNRQQVPANFIVDPASDAFDKLFEYEKDQITEPLKDRNNNFIVARVTEKVSVDPEAFMEALPDLRARETQTRANEMITAFVANARQTLQERGKIRIRKEFQESLEQ